MPVAAPVETAGSPHRFHSEQVSIYVGSQFVITLQEVPGDTFDTVRKRLRNDGSQFRRMGADYLAYTLIDSVIDAYFPILEQYGEWVEELELAVVERPHPQDIFRIHALKRDLLSIRRALWPMRDMLSAVLRDDTPLIHDATRIYLRDCHDHTIQLLDIVETYRELTSGLVDVHLSSVSNRMNEVMKVLTVIATIFIPLTFIAGIYGMNFDPAVGPWSMPELKSPYGYVGVIGVMIAIALGLLGWFHYKGWLRSAISPDSSSGSH
jgi:magnesium transporter